MQHQARQGDVGRLARQREQAALRVVVEQRRQQQSPPPRDREGVVLSNMLREYANYNHVWDGCLRIDQL